MVELFAYQDFLQGFLVKTLVCYKQLLNGFSLVNCDVVVQFLTLEQNNIVGSH